MFVSNENLLGNHSLSGNFVEPITQLASIISGLSKLALFCV